MSTTASAASFRARSSDHLTKCSEQPTPFTISHIEDVDRSGHWLAQGWRDFLAAPVVSLVYGAMFVLLSTGMVVGFLSLGLGSLILPFAGGFLILAPIFVVGLYDVSRRREQGKDVGLSNVFAAFSRSGGQLSAMGVALLICFLVWIEIALFLFMIFFHQAPPPLEGFITEIVFSVNGALLLGLGTVVGAVFAAIVFSISAVSVPLIYDRPIDCVSAIGISLLAVRENARVMFGWAALVAVVTAASVIVLPLLAVSMPVLAYATWHCYRDLVDYRRRYVEDVD